MASIPLYHSDFIPLCNQYCLPPTPSSGTTMWVDEEGLPFFVDNMQVPPETDVPSLSLNSVMPFPERFGVSSDMAVPVLAEFNNGFRGGVTAGSATESFESSTGSGIYYMQDMCEVGEEYCNGFVPDFQAVYPSSNDNWGFRVNQVPAMEEPCSKVGKYSVEERKDRIDRYLKKRNQRNFNKTIKYECRKTLADKRVRVRGRFARNNELCQGDHQAVTNSNNCNNNNNNNKNFSEDGEFYNDEIVKIKDDEEDDWLQEAITSLVYLPYISG